MNNKTFIKYTTSNTIIESVILEAANKSRNINGFISQYNKPSTILSKTEKYLRKRLQ